jgi:hypothetical protein
VAAEITIRIAKIPPYDGEYVIDLDEPFSSREWRWLKQLSDGELRPTNLTDELLTDPDFIIALAVIAMRRSRKLEKDEVLKAADVISDAPLDGAHIELVIPKAAEVVDEIPPASTSEPDRASSSDSLSNEDSTTESSQSSGNGSRIVSAPSDSSHAGTGATKSDTFSTSAPTSWTI